MSDATIDLIEFASLVPIKALGMEHCRELLNQSEVVAVSKGQLIFTQGDPAVSIVYVMSGDVELLIDK